jgi:hypothetical protein
VSDVGESDLRPAVLVDRGEYRLVGSRIRKADSTTRGRWLSVIGCHDVLRVIEADQRGLVPMNGREFAEAWGIGTMRTWDTWQSVMETAGVLSEVPGGFEVSPLERLPVGAKTPLTRAIAIDSMRYRLGVQRLARLDEDGRRWWSALGVWGLMRFVEGDPSTRVVPFSATELAETYGVDPRTWARLLELLEEAEFGAPAATGWQCAAFRAKRRGAKS